MKSTTIGATYIPGLNPQLINRVVGYFEYQQALARLDAFVKSATPEELDVAEQIVTEHDEFTLYTNLSRRLEPRTNSFSERSDAPKDNFARTGLAWVTALARIELATMWAGFSSDREPFSRIPVTRHDEAAYRELLQDAMRSHYWSLARDTVPRSMRRGATPEPQAIAYVRRTTLAIKLLGAVRDAERGQLTTAQQNDLDTWEQQLKELQSKLLYDVLGVHDAIASSNMHTDKDLYLNKCGVTRDQILDDIRSGAAKINDISPAAKAVLQKEINKTQPATTSSGATSPAPGSGSGQNAGATASGTPPSPLAPNASSSASAAKR